LLNALRLAGNAAPVPGRREFAAGRIPDRARPRRVAAYSLPGLVAALLALAPALPGADFGALEPQGYVSDFARVLPAPAKAALDGYCRRVEQTTGAQFALVTLPTLGGEPIEDVANLLYRKWGVGQKGSHEGALVLLVIRDRRSRVEVGYGLEPLIPDGFAGSVLREIRPALRNQDYAAALGEAARALGERVAQAKNVRIPEVQQRPLPRTPHREPFPWPMLAVGGLLLFWLFSGRGRGMSSGFLPGFLLGNLLSGGSRHHRSGGGFGGYDSGGGFGGFGGGDSGGGGASSDW
jgi:uncharacterized protein